MSLLFPYNLLNWLLFGIFLSTSDKFPINLDHNLSIFPSSKYRYLSLISPSFSFLVICYWFVIDMHVRKSICLSMLTVTFEGSVDWGAKNNSEVRSLHLKTSAVVKLPFFVGNFFSLRIPWYRKIIDQIWKWNFYPLSPTSQLG